MGASLSLDNDIALELASDRGRIVLSIKCASGFLLDKCKLVRRGFVPIAYHPSSIVSSCTVLPRTEVLFTDLVHLRGLSSAKESHDSAFRICHKERRFIDVHQLKFHSKPCGGPADSARLE